MEILGKITLYGFGVFLVLFGIPCILFGGVGFLMIGAGALMITLSTQGEKPVTYRTSTPVVAPSPPPAKSQAERAQEILRQEGYIN